MALGATERDPALDVSGDGTVAQSPETVDAHRPAIADEASLAKDAAPEASCDEAKDTEDAAQESRAEEEDIYACLQEDEETRSYMPDFIENWLKNPPVPPGMSSKVVEDLFKSVSDCMPPHRPKSDSEFIAVYNGALATARLMWLDRQTANLVKIHQRPAAEALHLKLQAIVPSSKKDKEDLERHAKEGAMDYFADPDYRNDFDSRLERGGFGADAVETEGFKRSTPSLTALERMRKSAIKERDQALKELKQAYSARDPEQRMPLSSAAERRFINEVREDKELARQERLLEQSQKAALDGDA
jgi:hypothetical protein